MPYGNPMDIEPQQPYDEMLDSLRKIAMDKLFTLMDRADDAAYAGDVKETQQITKEALLQVEMVSGALFNIICDAYGTDQASIDKVENDCLKEKVKTQFLSRIVLAIHIRNCIDKGVPEV